MASLKFAIFRPKIYPNCFQSSYMLFFCSSEFRGPVAVGISFEREKGETDCLFSGLDG